MKISSNYSFTHYRCITSVFIQYILFTYSTVVFQQFFSVFFTVKCRVIKKPIGLKYSYILMTVHTQTITKQQAVNKKSLNIENVKNSKRIT